MIALTRRARGRSLTATLAVAVSALACGAPGPPRESPSRVLRVGLTEPPTGWDPHRVTDTLTTSILYNIFDGLTGFDSVMQVRPALAGRRESRDELTWRFHLREGAAFHDGRSVQAEDVRFSLERARRHPTMGGNLLRSSIASIAVVGEGSVEIQTTRPVVNLAAQLALIMIVPRDSPEVIEHPVGSGPFRYASHDSGGVELRRAPGPRERAPGWAGVRFRFESDPATQVAALLAGDLDLIWRLQPRFAPLLDGDSCCRLDSQPDFTVQVLSLNVSRPPFDDPRVRTAIDLAVDRRLLASASQGGHARPVWLFASPMAFGYTPELDSPQPDPARARGLLAAAGHPDGLVFDLVHREEVDVGPLREQLLAAGLDATPQPRPWAEIAPRLMTGQVGAYFGGIAPGTGDALDLLLSVAHSRDGTHGALNVFGYSNADLDVHLETCLQAIDIHARLTCTREALHLFADDAQMIALYAPHLITAYRDSVVWTGRPDGLLIVSDVVPGPGAGEGSP